MHCMLQCGAASDRVRRKCKKNYYAHITASTPRPAHGRVGEWRKIGGAPQCSLWRNNQAKIHCRLLSLDQAVRTTSRQRTRVYIATSLRQNKGSNTTFCGAQWRLGSKAYSGMARRFVFNKTELNWRDWLTRDCTVWTYHSNAYLQVDWARQNAQIVQALLLWMQLNAETALY